jgi:serine/threonine-protein kinase
MIPGAAARRPVGPGAIVGRYQLERVLGEGATGTVYLAERLDSEPPSEKRAKPGAQVALKVIHRHLVRERQVSARFLREASILRRLRGEHLVGLLDFGELDDGLLYMAQELVQGRGLDELAAAGRLDRERAVRLVQHICRALEAAHAAGVVHRDLKPSNVIVEATADGSERARVLDFGMAKVLRGDGSDSLTALTEQNMVFGTPEYMAPEQARGDEVDARCDVYAAGVILYELVTGGVPFTAATPIGVMTAHLVEEPEAPSLRAPGRITPALEAVMLHALAKDRSLRYPTARTLAEALDAATQRPLDLAGTLPPPSAEDEFAVRDTEHELDVDPALRRTEPGQAAPRAHTPSHGWLIWAVVAALLGIAVGVLLGF